MNKDIKLSVKHLRIINTLNTFKFFVVDDIKTLYIEQEFIDLNGFEKKFNFKNLKYLAIGSIEEDFEFLPIILSNSTICLNK